MPSLGADMEAGTLVEWLVKPGDRVKRGDIVAVVETQKGAIEIEIFETGQIEQILVDLNAKVPVGTPLREFAPTSKLKPGAAAPAAAAIDCCGGSGAAGPGRGPAGPRTISPPSRPAVPAVRRCRPRARRRRRGGLPRRTASIFPTIAGSGPAGAITYADVERRLGAIRRPGGKEASDRA